MAHVRLHHRIILTIGFLATLAGCGRDESASEVARLRDEVAAMRVVQGELQTTVAALQQREASPLPAEVSIGEDGVPREVVRQIPTSLNPSKGPPAATVTVIGFADFQCPYCQAAAGLPDQLIREFPDHVRFVFKNYPLSKHLGALDAAKAAWAAHQQGKFWQMHDMIYGGDIQSLSLDVLRGYAEKIGLDMAKYDADVDSERATKAVMFDRIAAKSAKVRGTPTYFVNGKRVADGTPAGVRAKVRAEVRAEVEAYQKRSQG